MAHMPSSSTAGSPVRQFTFGRYSLDATRRRLLQDGVSEVDISPKTFDLLLVLVERAGQVVPKRELMELVWPDVCVDEVNLAQHVSLLRKALGDDPKRPGFVATVPRRGYQFVAPVGQLATQLPEPRRRRRPRLGPWLAAGVAASVPIVFIATGGTRPAPAPATSEASAAFAQGRYFLARSSPTDSRLSYEAFASAARSDDRSGSLRHAGIALSTVAMYMSREMPLTEARTRAQSATTTALALDNRSSTAYEALAAVQLQLEHNWPAAAQSIDRALALDPNNAGALDLRARGLRQTGQLAASIDAARAALALEPTSVRAHLNLAHSLFFAGDLDEAAAVAERASRFDRGSTIVLELLADVREAQGEFARSIEARTAAERLAGRLEIADGLRGDYAKYGFRPAMTRFHRARLAMLASEPATPATNFERGRLLLRLGQTDAAVKLYDEMLEEGFNPGLLALEKHPLYAVLAAEPPLARLTRLQRPAPEIVGGR